MTRRQLAGLAGGSVGGSSALLAQARGTSSYTGPLDGALDKVDTASFDPVAFSLKLYESAPMKLAFRAKDRRQAEAWQKQLRSKVAELLGGFPETRGALRSQTLEVRDFPKYRREKFVFESKPGVMVLGYLLLPAGAKTPVPATICVPGHGRGVDDIIGVDDKGSDRTDREGYQHDFAIQAAEHGMAVVAIEPMAFGCRRDPKTRKKGLSTSACQPAAGAALLLGQTMIGWRVWDVMRTIDWIATRPELNANRVACMGISGGGTVTLFSTALDLRIKAAMVSGYLNTFRDSIMSLSHCIDNYIPGILNWAEMYDVAGLIAPRPLFAESGERDPIFPIAASRRSFARVREIYDVFGAADRVERETFDDVHTFYGRKGLPFLAQNL